MEVAAALHAVVTVQKKATVSTVINNNSVHEQVPQLCRVFFPKPPGDLTK